VKDELIAAQRRVRSAAALLEPATTSSTAQAQGDGSGD